MSAQGCCARRRASDRARAPRARPALGVIQTAETLVGKREIAQYERVPRVESRGLLQVFRCFLDATQPEIAEPEHVVGFEVRRRRPQHLETVRNGVVEVATLKRRFSPRTQRRNFRDDGCRDCAAALLYFLPLPQGQGSLRPGCMMDQIHAVFTLDTKKPPAMAAFLQQGAAAINASSIAGACAPYADRTSCVPRRAHRG